MMRRGQFQFVDTVCDCVTYVQMVAVSFVTLVCSPSMSVIIADLAKQSIYSLDFEWLFTNFYVRMEDCAY